MGELSFNNDNILKSFPPCLQENIKHLCLYGKLGLSSITLNDVTIQEREAPLPNHHFTLRVPYGGKRMLWDVIFNPEDFQFAPDFDFNDEHFLADPDVEICRKFVPSLVDWDLAKPNAMLDVLNEFLVLYKKLQVEKLTKENVYVRFQSEYQSLLEKFSEDQVEVAVDSCNVIFLISIPAECSGLPHFAQPNSDPAGFVNPGPDYIHLKITFLKLDGSKFTDSIQLSPRLHQILRTFPQLNIPKFDGESVLEHALKVDQFFTTCLKEIQHNYEEKQSFVFHLVSVCATSTIEYDDQDFSMVTFSCGEDDFPCIARVDIDMLFPEQKPTVTLFTVNCPKELRCHWSVENSPFEGCESTKDMVEALLEALTLEVVKFKEHSH